jgi:hypothetical protein
MYQSPPNCGCGRCDPSWLQNDWLCQDALRDQSLEFEVRRRGTNTLIAVPQHAIGKLIGKRGETIKQIQERTHCSIHIENDAHGPAKALCEVRIRSTAQTPKERESSVGFCLHIVQALCQEQSSQMSLEDVICAIQAEKEIEEQQKIKSQIEAQQNQAIQQVKIAVGDCFSDTQIREALVKTDWDSDQAQELLFQEKHAVEARPQPAINVKSLLDVCRAQNAARKLQEAENCDGRSSESGNVAEDCASSAASTASSEHGVCKPSSNVKMIQDVFNEIRRINNEMEYKSAALKKPIASSRDSIAERVPRKSQGKRRFVKMQV